MKFTALSLCIVLSLSALSDAAQVPTTLVQKPGMKLGKASGKENTPEKGSSTGTKASGDSGVVISSANVPGTSANGAIVPKKRKRVATSKGSEGRQNKTASITGASPKKQKPNGQENNSSELNTSQYTAKKSIHSRRQRAKPQDVSTKPDGGPLQKHVADKHDSGLHSLQEAANMLLNDTPSKAIISTEGNNLDMLARNEKEVVELLFSMAANSDMTRRGESVGKTGGKTTNTLSSASASNVAHQTPADSKEHRLGATDQQGACAQTTAPQVFQSQEKAMVRSLFIKLPSKNSKVTISVEPFKPQFEDQDGRGKEGLNTMRFGQLRLKEFDPFFKMVSSAKQPAPPTPAPKAAAATTTTTTTRTATVPTVIVTAPPVAPDLLQNGSNGSAAAPSSTPASTTGRSVPAATRGAGVATRLPTAGLGHALRGGRRKISTTPIESEPETTGQVRAPAGAPRNAVMTTFRRGPNGFVPHTTDGRGSPCRPTGRITFQVTAPRSPAPPAPASTPAVNEISQSYTF